MTRYIIRNELNCEIANVDAGELAELMTEGYIKPTDTVEEYEPEED